MDDSGFTFLTDDSTASFFNDHLKDEYKSFLAQSNNLIAVEQYLDYFTNRDKRNSLFCKSSQITGQKQPLEIDRLFDVEICSKIKVDSTLDKLMTDEPQVFSIDEDLSITVDTRIMKIALKILSDVYPKYISFNNLYKSCLDYLRYKMVSVQESDKDLKNSFVMQLLKLSFGLRAGIIKLSHYKRDKSVLNAIKAKVGISSLNYALLKSDKVMLDIDGKRVSFDDVGYVIYRHLTESTAVTDLIKKVIDMLNSGEIAMSIINQHSDSGESIESIANRITFEYLNKLLNLGILLDCKC